MTAAVRRLRPSHLRELFLFAELDAPQLHWVASNHEVIDVSAGTVIAREGEPAERLFVLLSGTVSMSRRSGGGDVEIVRSSTRGVFCGAVQFYFGDSATRPYATTCRAVSDCSFVVLSAGEFAVVFRRWYPMAIHLLNGMFVALHTTEELVGQRERLASLGARAAGLAHELNNPAAATARAAGALQDRMTAGWTTWAELADAQVGPRGLRELLDLRTSIGGRVADRGSANALELADREEVVADWLRARGVDHPWECAPVFAALGVGVPELQQVAAAVGDTALGPALRWLAAAFDTQALVADLADASRRITELVAASKEYAQLDRTPFQATDLAAGLDATLTVLRARIGPSVTVVRAYDEALPAVPGDAAELNQVWTQLIANALDAMAGDGTLTVRTTLDGDSAVVEVADTGPGIPPDVRGRVFEPFFTTKPVGSGTGLGLDICRRIVVDRHAGDLRAISRPGDTRFQVRLPLSERRGTSAGHP